MIGIVLIIVTMLFFCACNVCKHHNGLYGTIAFVLLFITIGSLTLNFSNHLGMKLRNNQRTTQIKPMNKQGNIILYKSLGTQRKHNVYLYRIFNNSHIKHTKLDISNKNKIYRTNRKYGYITKKNHEWKYTPQGKIWFGFMKPTSTVKDTTTKFYLPQSWNVLTVKQAKLIKKYAHKDAKQMKMQMKSPQAQMMMKQKMQQMVQQKMIKEQKTQIPGKMMQDPRIQQDVMKQVIKQVKEQMKVQAKQQILQKAIQQAKNK